MLLKKWTVEATEELVGNKTAETIVKQKPIPDKKIQEMLKK